MKAIFAIISILALAAAPGLDPGKLESRSDSLDFSYSWPVEAVAKPALDSALRKRAGEALTEARTNASEDQASAIQDKREFHAHYLAMGWETAGQTQRLLSLGGSIESFTGGAHPNHGFDAILWDRTLDRAVAVSGLFTNAASLPALMRTAYCKALDGERLKRREGEKLGGMFDDCPKFSELAIVPADNDHDGRFEAIDFVAAPYVAGPYVEGEYVTSLKVSAKLIAAMKPQYRGSFKAHLPQ